MLAQFTPVIIFNKTREKQQATSFTNYALNMIPLHFILPFALCCDNRGGGSVILSSCRLVTGSSLIWIARSDSNPCQHRAVKHSQK